MRNTLVGIILAIATFGYAQSAQSLIGEPLNSEKIESFFDALGERGVESFNPDTRNYIISIRDKGVVLKFDVNLILNRIEMYNEGHTFKSFPLSLPHGIKWGEDSTSVNWRHGVKMNYDPRNPFISYERSEDARTAYFFTDNQLESIRIEISEKLAYQRMEQLKKIWGIRLLPDGLKISGNTLDGKGVMMWGDSLISYNGEWAYGLPHGSGLYRDFAGNTINGEFKLGFVWGEAQFTSAANDQKYVGKYILGKRQGQGSAVYADGSTYSGEWFQDMMHGQGQMIYPNGVSYSGEFTNNNVTGQGKLVTPDGYLQGSFKSGKPHGLCTQYITSSNQSLSGNFVNGLKNGEFTYYDGKKKEIILFENDIQISNIIRGN